jgi:DNA (cytosine-5)-methyltransferase 1
MGFETKDREFKIRVSDTQAYKQFGNAVVVPVVEFIARALKPYIEEALQADAPQKETKIRKVTRPQRQSEAA